MTLGSSGSREWVAALLLQAMAVTGSASARQMAKKTHDAQIAMAVTPAAPGRQLVRALLPFPRGMVHEGQIVVASDGRRNIVTAVRPLTWHPAEDKRGRSLRRALVTFPYTFRDDQSVQFILRSEPAERTAAYRFSMDVKVDGESVTVAYNGGPALEARLLAPARASSEEPTTETVESNRYFLWKRTHLPDPQWPRVIEVRVDALGGVVLVAHLQRNRPGNGWAPDFGWEVRGTAAAGHMREGDEEVAVTEKERAHSFSEGQPCTVLLEGGRYRLYLPRAPFEKRGRVEVRKEASGGLSYRYLRSAAGEKAPMQQASWRRVELVVAPVELAPLTATLEYPHEVKLNWRLWDQVYHMGGPTDLKGQPELAALMRYHRDAIVHSVAQGDDWGNLTDYADGRRAGGVFGMNRLNHCVPIFEEAFRSGERRLTEVAVLWCENFHDQSVWWGPGETGGTRYNNIIAQGEEPPDGDRSYMWRSNGAVNFCTKGFAAFLSAYEQTGDPRMMEVLQAQARYAAEHVHADRGECRNVGVVSDFVRLYELTGEKRYLDEALRLFRELRTKLSAGDLFSQGGRPIEPDPPFIDDDEVGYRHPFAKPYIIGYALAGLPGLARYAPGEPRLRDVVQAVADFVADSQDPIGGWRYPHPRSSYVIMSLGMEHAWQLVQADRFLGPQEKHLNAMERVMRQRILGWKKTGKVFGSLTGREMAAGGVKQRSELYNLYKRPEDRDFTRDYADGQPEFGFSPPEGLVYFPEVLAFYLKHRPAARLLAAARDEEPLGKVLTRVGGGRQ